MSDNLPALSPDPQVLLAALARAAAEYAAQEGAKRQGAPPLDRDAVEEIANACVQAALLRLGVDLKTLASVEAFNAKLAHAERSRSWWDKAGATALTGLVMAVVSIVIAALSKYGLPGAPR